ncbi:DEAD/DEAH box helicase [Persicitalea jodogahamensis]|uniref:RNA helicase n=1 Tax=Persicitalea jodogahamensis TaxID=402147 RepID=A0A8J3D4H5_9BACT|nr:DEAD/DEAH box helicase [Persicitalea jodogahamensis]GHB58534.1 RNA helicase [Persicitalea jodogahamensis]
MLFKDLALHGDILNAVDAMNFSQTTPIQELAIPPILEGKDLIGCAQTGTGKTAAFLIPTLDYITQHPQDKVTALIIVPTRELATQIDGQVQGLGYFCNATSIAIYGGTKGPEWDQQRKALEQGADIIIATPGRLMAHMQLGYVDFSHIKFLILDEADRMLDMGFVGDILAILKSVPDDRQTLMFSATMPPKISDFAKKILRDPVQVQLSVSKPAAGIDQQFYMAGENQKLPLLVHLLKAADDPSMVLFTSRRSSVDSIVRALRRKGFKAEGISSDSEQAQREVVLRDFKNRTFPILVATDVLSRGIDIDNLSHVVNYDLPRDPEDYVHRIGRTARAESKGTAITFLGEADKRGVQGIERLLERSVNIISMTEELGLGPAPVFGDRSSGNDRSRGRGSSNQRSRGGNARRGSDSRRREGSKSASSGTSGDGAPTAAATSDVTTPTGGTSDSTGEKKRRRKPRNKRKSPRADQSPATE